MTLLIDNYDSFSYNLYQLVGMLDPAIRVIRNDAAGIEDIAALKKLMDTFLVDILGIRTDAAGADSAAGVLKPYEEAVDLLLEIRGNAKKAKDWSTSDLIRDRLAAIGFDVKDTKDGFEWSLK